MAAPALLRNFTARGWRAPAGSQQFAYVFGLNINANTTFSVVTKSDANLTINTLTYFEQSGVQYLQIAWSYATTNNSSGSATATIRATNSLGEYSDCTVNFSFAPRVSTAPGFDNYGGSLSCANRGNVSVSEFMFINTNNGISTGILSVDGDPDTLNNLTNGSPYNVIHVRRTSNTSAEVWCAAATLPTTGNISASCSYRLSTTPITSGVMGGNQNVTINGTATVTRLANLLGPFSLAYDEGFLHEIFYLGALPESISITGLPTGLSVIKRGYRYFIGGNPTAIGTFNCTVVGFQTSPVSPNFTIEVTGTPPVLTKPAAGTIPQITIPINKPFAGYQPEVQQPYIFPLTWSIGGLPPGLTADSNSGLISGTPTTLGTYTPVIIVNGGGFIDSGNISITVVNETVRRIPTEFFDNFYIN